MSPGPRLHAPARHAEWGTLFRQNHVVEGAQIKAAWTLPGLAAHVQHCEFANLVARPGRLCLALVQRACNMQNAIIDRNATPTGRFCGLVPVHRGLKESQMSRRRRLREESFDIDIASAPRNLIDGCVEVVARLADTADRITFAAVDSDPRFGARSSGDVLRQAPDACRRAAFALNDGLIDVNDSIVDLLDLRTWDKDQAIRSPAATTARPIGLNAAERRDAAEALTERDIVDATQRLIDSGRNRGTTFGALVRYLGPQTRYTADELRAIVARHFLMEGDLILPAGGDDAKRHVELPDSIEAHLKALGYDDLRYNVPLEILGDRAKPALSVAYKGKRPLVLVYRVPAGRLSDFSAEEDARFEAHALSRSHPPRFIYLTDGSSNRYIDLEQDRVVSELPRAAGAAA